MRQAIIKLIGMSQIYINNFLIKCVPVILDTGLLCLPLFLLTLLCLMKPDHSYSGSEGNEKLILFFLAVTTCAQKYETIIQNKYHKVPKY